MYVFVYYIKKTINVFAKNKNLSDIQSCLWGIVKTATKKNWLCVGFCVYNQDTTHITHKITYKYIKFKDSAQFKLIYIVILWKQTFSCNSLNTLLLCITNYIMYIHIFIHTYSNFLQIYITFIINFILENVTQLRLI